MARVEKYIGQRLRITEVHGDLMYKGYGPSIHMPAVLWSDSEPWLPAMAYLRKKAFDSHATGGSPTTIVLHATALAAYATFLEGSEDLSRDCLPEDRSLRPTYRYRGHLIGRVNARNLARSTAANHISVLTAFYAWAAHQGYLVQSAQPYKPRQVAVRYTDVIGQDRVKVVTTSDLAIRRPSVASHGVEEGCKPLRMADRDRVLAIAKDHFRPEFELVLKVGFFTGMRLGTILGLTYTTLRHHFPSQDIPSWISINVGPEHGIATKRGVTYAPSMPAPLFEELITYCRSVRRAIRGKNASLEDKDLVLLNKNGGRLTTRSFPPRRT